VFIDCEANSAAALIGLVVPANGSAYVVDCVIRVVQNGAGTGVAIGAFDRGGSLGDGIDDPGLIGCTVYGSTADIV